MKNIIFIILLLFIIYILFYKKCKNTKLANTYHNKFDGDNAIKYYNKCLKENNPLVLINIGSIYHYGINNNTNINLFKAFQCYYTLLQLLKNKNDIDSRKYKFYAFNKINQIYDELNEMPHNQPKEIKFKKEIIVPSTNEFMMKSILKGFDKKDLFSNQKVNTQIQQREILQIQQQEPLQRININDYIDNRNLRANRDLNELNIIPANVYNPLLQDPQNVHDSFINNTISNSINNIKNKEFDMNLNYQDIENILNNEIDKKDFNPAKRNNIKRVLENINNSNFKSIKNNMTIKEALVLVFNKIYNKNDTGGLASPDPRLSGSTGRVNDEEIKKAFISNLLNELNDCVENNNVVCGTGIFNRIFSSINLLDADVTVKSYDTLNTEIMNKCIAIRNKLEETVNPNSDNFDELLKNNIKDEMYNDYVKSNILTQEQLDDIMKVWIDHI
jgi:hypothetical protein